MSYLSITVGGDSDPVSDSENSGCRGWWGRWRRDRGRKGGALSSVSNNFWHRPNIFLFLSHKYCHIEGRNVISINCARNHYWLTVDDSAEMLHVLFSTLVNWISNFFLSLLLVAHGDKIRPRIVTSIDSQAHAFKSFRCPTTMKPGRVLNGVLSFQN